MKTLILILLSLSLTAQSPQGQPRAEQPVRNWLSTHNDAAHFYGSCLVNDFSYSTQGLIWKDWTPAKKLLFSNVTTLGMISLKEAYDIKKPNPTGWSWDDFFMGVWAMLIYTLVRICINDFRGNGLIPRKKKNNYYIGKDL